MCVNIKLFFLADMVESADVITQDSEKYVERLLTLFKRFSRLVSEAFRDDPRFLTSRDKAFKRVVNDTSIFRLELPNRPSGYHTKTLPESKCPELLGNALYQEKNNIKNINAVIYLSGLPKFYRFL